MFPPSPSPLGIKPLLTGLAIVFLMGLAAIVFFLTGTPPPPDVPLIEPAGKVILVSPSPTAPPVVNPVR